MRCWRCAASPPCGSSCARCRTAARAGSCSRACASASGFETKMGAALLVVPGDRRGLAVGRAARPPRRGAPAARRRRRDGRRRRRVAAAHGAHARREPPVDLGHQRQQHPQPDPRLQRPRAPRRPGRRPAEHGRRRAGRRHDVRRRHRPAAAAQRGPRAARPAGCWASRSSRSIALAVATRLRRADARTGWLIATGGMLPDHGRRVQRRPGDLPSLLRRAAGALHGGAGRRGVRLVPVAPPRRGRCSPPRRWRPAW